MKCFYCRDKSKAGSKSSPEPRKRGEDTVRTPPRSTSVLQSPRRRGVEELYRERQREGVVREFSFRELSVATHGFSRMLRIGGGGFGSVYKGAIEVVAVDGKTTTTTTTTKTTLRPLVVAIKRLNQHGLQGRKEWQAEVQFLSVVDHPNLVKLLGYCSMENDKGPQLLLVYEYMRNRSLDEHLFGRAFPVLPWKTRLEVILDAAEGLAYLHEGMEITVIYRDFKSSNVLLDEDFRAKLSDFGLAREGPVDNRSHVTTVVIGTYGYAAPEYVETGHLTIRSDVWTFGVVLYELLTGRRAVETTRPQNEQKLLDWVKHYPSDGKTFSMIIDPRLRDQYSYSAAQMVGKLAESCLNKNAKDRPSMKQVTAVLKQAILESRDVKGSGDRVPGRRRPERRIGGFLERASEG